MIEGIKLDGDKEIIQPEMKKLNLEDVPVIRHDGTQALGYAEIVEYIENTFDQPNFFFPEGDYRTTVSAYCETFVQSSLPWGFFPMLLYQDK